MYLPMTPSLCPIQACTFASGLNTTRPLLPLRCFPSRPLLSHASSGLVTEFVFPRESCMWDNFSVRRVIQASSHFRTMTADGIRVMWNERKKEKKHFSFIEVNVLNCVVYKKNSSNIRTLVNEWSLRKSGMIHLQAIYSL